MKEICRDERKTAVDSEGKKAVRNLWHEAVCVAVSHGKSSSIDVNDQFGKRIKNIIESQSVHLFGRKKVTDVISVSREILDEKNKSTKVSVSSYLGKSKDTEGVSIIFNNDFATLLVMRGEKINIETWRRFGEICWDVRIVNVNKELELASGGVKLLQESLSGKK